MRFRAVVDGVDHQVDVGSDGALTVDAQPFQAKLSKPAADRWVVQVGDKSYEVRVVEDGTGTGAYVLELAGERIPITVSSVSKAGAAVVRAPTPTIAAPSVAASTKPQDVGGEGIRAPMPGKVVNVLVGAGDKVEAGDVVLTLEAMKMENELRAPRKATVASVLVKTGDPAERGQLLMTFE